MRKHSLFVIVFALGACGPAPEAETETVIQEVPAPEKRMVAILGDSTAECWAAKLQELRPDLHIINHAQGGALTEKVLDQQWTVNTKPMGNVSAIVVLAGVNDVFQNLGPYDAIERLKTIYREADLLEIEVYAVVTLPFANWVAGVYGQSVVNAMGQLQYDIRWADHVTSWIDLVEEFETNQGYYTDAIHHTEAAQARIAEAVGEVVR